MSWLFFFIYNCSGVGRLYTKYTKYHVIINPSGIGAGTDRVLSYFFFPGRDRDLERDLSEASFCNYLLSSFFFLFSSNRLSTCIYSFSILLYTGVDVCSNCILGPTVVNSGSALTSEFRPGSIQDDDTKCNSSGFLSYHHVCDL